MSGLSDDQVVTQTRDALASCIPPISFNSIEAGDFADGHRFIALVDFLRDGQARLGTKKMNIFQLQPVLVKALESICSNKGNLPSFRLQAIIGCDKTETMRLLRWILGFRKPAGVLPIDAWLRRMGIEVKGSESIANPTTIRAIAERFGLSGNPFEAFRNAGITIPIPDDPATALKALFRVSGGKIPGEIHFVHDGQSEAELSRIHEIIENMDGRCASSLFAEARIVSDLRMDVKNLKERLDLTKATNALATRTNEIIGKAEKVLNSRERDIQKQLQKQREENENAAKEEAARFESQARTAYDEMGRMFALAVRKTPDSFHEIELRLQSLNMESVTESFEIAALGARWLEKRIEDLRRQRIETTEKVAERICELEELMRSIQDEKGAKHARILKEVKTILGRVETAIDERTDDFETRCSVLEDQDCILSEQHSFVVDEGNSLDEDLRVHRIEDFERIGSLEARIEILREKVCGLIVEEKEVERRRCGFRDALELGRAHFESIERKLESITFEPLATVRCDKGLLVELHASMIRDGKLVDEAWETLITMRSFPDDCVIDFRRWMSRLQTLYEMKVEHLDEAIVHLEAKGISDFMSQFNRCQSIAQDSERLYAELPIEPGLRISQLSQIQKDLQREMLSTLNLYEWLGVHELDERILKRDVDSLHGFRDMVNRYSRELSLLTNYLSALDTFHSRTIDLEWEIANLRSQADMTLNARERLRNMTLYRGLVRRSDIIFHHFLGVSANAMAQAEESGQDDNDIRITRDRLRTEYDATLSYMRNVINERTPRRSHVPDENFRDIVGYNNALEPLRWIISRSTMIEDFVALAVKKHDNYYNQHHIFHIDGEVGIDVGGLSREIFSMICDPLLRRALVPAGSGDILWFPGNEMCDSNRLNDLIAVGFLLRLTILMEQSVTNLLPLPFFHALTVERLTLRDLRIIHPETSSSMQQVKEVYDNGENIELYLADGREVTADLIDIYIAENLKLLMETQVSKAVDAVRRGFHGRSMPNWASSFTSNDLHLRVTGPTVVDWTEMKRSCEFKGYSRNDISVQLFWQVFDHLNEEERVALLTFITSSDRPPALGFASRPIVLVKCEWNSVMQNPLPRAHTCFMTLDLPNVTDENMMKKLVQICIEYNRGFGSG